MIIHGGTGNGYSAKVSKENMLKVESVNDDKVAHVSLRHGNVYSWSNVTYDYDAGDTILLIKNTSTSKNLRICKIYIGGDTASIVTIHCPSCATPTGTTVTGINMNRLSGKIAEATAIADETTNSQANIFLNTYITAASTKEIQCGGALILGLNDCIAVDFATNGSAAYVTIIGFYHEDD